VPKVMKIHLHLSKLCTEYCRLFFSLDTVHSRHCGNDRRLSTGKKCSDVISQTRQTRSAVRAATAAAAEAAAVHDRTSICFQRPEQVKDRRLSLHSPVLYPCRAVMTRDVTRMTKLDSPDTHDPFRSL